MRKKLVHLLFGVSQLIFALLAGASSFQQEKHHQQKRFIVESPTTDGVQFRQRLLFPSSLHSHTEDDAVEPRKWKRVSVLIPSTSNRLMDGTEVRQPCPRPHSYRLCSNIDISSAHSNMRLIKRVRMGLNEIQERLRQEKIREFGNFPNRVHQQLTTSPPILESLEKRDYDQPPLDGEDGAHDARDFSVPPRYYPEDGPKRNWRVNLMRVWGKRSLANPFFAVDLERQQHI